MFARRLRLKSFAVASLIAVACLLGNVATAAPAKTITFGWTAWSDAEFVTKLAKDLIQKHYGYEVNLTLADIGLQYAGIAKESLDGMLMAWLPDTHRAYWGKVGTQVCDLGPLYTGAKLGWVVPDYAPADQLDSIENLKKPAVRSKLGGSIQGIDPEAGLMQLSDKAIKEYGLNNYDLISASGAAMAAALAHAERQRKWIVVTGVGASLGVRAVETALSQGHQGSSGRPSACRRCHAQRVHPGLSSCQCVPGTHVHPARPVAAGNVRGAEDQLRAGRTRLRNGASLPYPLLVHG